MAVIYARSAAAPTTASIAAALGVPVSTVRIETKSDLHRIEATGIGSFSGANRTAMVNSLDPKEISESEFNAR